MHRRPDVGTMDLVTQHESANGRCSLCGRECENVTSDEFGGWMVHNGAILLCSGCSSDPEKQLPAKRA